MMKLTVDLTKENGFRIKADNHVFVCDKAAEMPGPHTTLSPAQLLIASLGASISQSAVEFCKEHSLPVAGLKTILDWEFSGGQNRIGRIDVSVHMPDAVSETLEDDFMSAIHQCEVYQTLQFKPEMHFHSTLDVEKPEGETVIHFAGAE